MTGAVLRRRCRALAAQTPAGLTTGTDDGPLFGARFAHGTAPLGITSHHEHSLVQQTTPSGTVGQSAVGSGPVFANGTTRSASATVSAFTGHGPDRPVLGVLDGKTRRRQAIPDRVGGREVASGAGRGTFLEQRDDQRPGGPH